jgi:hypothetical protein
MILDEESERAIKELSGVSESIVEFILRLWHPPDVKFDSKKIIQYIKDKKIRKCTAQLGKIADHAYQIFSLSDDIRRVLNIQLSDKDKDLLFSLSKKIKNF